MKRPKSSIIQGVTMQYLSGQNFPQPPLSDADRTQLAEELMGMTVLELESANAGQQGGSRYRIPDDISPYQVANLMMKFEDVINVMTNPTNPDITKLALYIWDGPRAGTYTLNLQVIENLVRKYAPIFSSKEIAETISILESQAPRRDRTRNRDLIPVANGVFDYKTKTVTPYSPDYVFLSKCAVPFNPNAVNVVIHNPDDGTDWDVESWMADLNDDPAVVNLLWQITGACVRQFVSWDRMAWLYSTTGANGKGTLCAMLRNLLGPGNSADMKLTQFGKDFFGADLLTANAVIADENDVGKLIDQAGTLKAAITQDVFTINPKFEKPYSFRFFGMMVQCFNEFPRIKDKSGSMSRRILPVPFPKTYLGAERKYIKHDYMERPEVLEYVLFKVLAGLPDYYEFDIPPACMNLLDQYETYNNPVKEFVNDVLPAATWTLLPFDLLYEMYKTWFERNAPNGKPINRSRFLLEIQDEVFKLGWRFPDRNADGKYKQVWSKGRMVGPEPLILEYCVEKWYNNSYRGTDPMKRAQPASISASYRGIYKLLNGPVPEDDGPGVVTDEDMDRPFGG